MMTDALGSHALAVMPVIHMYRFEQQDMSLFVEVL